MIELDRRRVRLQGSPSSKEEAIRQAAQILVESGNIRPGYIESMFGREKVANTYLGNGIAIPHGLPEDRNLINETGIAVMQVPAGVTWGEGETVHIVVSIAAKGDEHIGVLRRLTRVLGNKELVEKLIQTDDEGDIVEALTGERPPEPEPAETPPDYEHYFDIVVENPTGLHARPATRFVDLAKQYGADVRVRRDNEAANGKSLISLLQLGIERGAEIRVSAQGDDAEAALDALREAITAGLGDEMAEPEPSPTQAGTHDWAPDDVGATITGITAANGLAVGKVRRYSHQKIVVEDEPGNPVTEGNRFQEALNVAHDELDELYEEVKKKFGGGKASIFKAHAEFLEDTDMIQSTVSLIFEGHSAAWSWQKVIDDRVNKLQKLDDPVLAGRAVDLSDVGQRVLRHLVGAPEQSAFSPLEPVVLVAKDLTPSDTASMDTDVILGFLTAAGGPTSHTAIMARSLGIPAVVGAGKLALDLKDGTPVILDGYHGKLYVEPSQADVTAAREVQWRLQQEQEAADATRFEPASTRDGHRVEVAANINRSGDVRKAVEAGAEGVGLMRTEFLFLERKSAPSEEEQFNVYREMAETLDGKPLIIRTLDIGGDKEVPYLDLPKEDNAFLGIRGIRLCLDRPELFEPQLRAIYRAAAFGPIQIMFPMISTLEDFEKASAIAGRVRRELDAPEVPLGMMVEVPSAVILADQFAQEVSFFSIGTNDLTQYTLAMDRLHPQLAKQADALHPAVLRMIDQTVQAASQHDCWVGVCGGIAADPKGAVLLTGLGVSELSVNIPSIAAVKAQIRRHSLKEMQEKAQAALRCRTAAEVREL